MASDPDAEAAAPGPPADTTSLHLRRAVDGDVDSLSWLVGSFSPLLLAQARYRMGPHLRRTHDPEDVVSEVWIVALPRLRGLAPRSGRFTPVVLKFLSTVLLHRVNRLVRRQFASGGVPRTVDPDFGSDIPEAAASTNGVVTSIVRREQESLVMTCLEELDAADKEVIILRSIEQRPGDQVARILGVAPANVYVRHHRALERLRRRLPDSVFKELEP